MCGIAGVFVLAGAADRADANAVRVMCQQLRHRGPDGAGIWTNPSASICLGHRRLAIVDLSDRAAQPMTDPSGRYTIVFNGEIYNSSTLRAAMAARGVRDWSTDHSDTEVLLFALRERGLAALAEVRGMFAFALWDEVRRVLVLARDRLGEKPLYYCVEGRRIAFASEASALIAAGLVEPVANLDALSSYLSNLTFPAPATAFAGVRKLRPAEIIELSFEGAERRRLYWDPLTGSSIDGEVRRPARFSSSNGDLGEEVFAEIDRSVRERAMGDVPVGVFLSGGVDSSLNAALFRQSQTGDVNTFSVGYAEGGEELEDETGEARQFAAQLGTIHHERRLSSSEFVAFTENIGSLLDEPNADPVCFPVYHLGRMARESGVLVAQVGEGADELFWGYPSWSAEWRRHQRVSEVIQYGGGWLADVALSTTGRAQSRWREYVARARERTPLFWGGAEYFTRHEASRVLTTRVRASRPSDTAWASIAPWLDQYRLAGGEGATSTKWMSYLDLRVRIPELLLGRVDRMTMAHGVEARVPFLDHLIVESVLGLPENVRVSLDAPKQLLKRAARDVLPVKLLARRKRGFGVPLASWQSGSTFLPLFEDSRQLLEEEVGFIRPGSMAWLRDTGRHTHLWSLVVLARWWRHWRVRMP